VAVLGVLLAISLIVVTSAAGERHHAGASPLEPAIFNIQSAIRYEQDAEYHERRGSPEAADDNLESAARALDRAGKELGSTSLVAADAPILSDIARAEKIDKSKPRDGKLVEELALAIRLKKRALEALQDLAGETTPPPSANVLTSPVGSGPIKVTNVKCYANGTGGNPERDADFSVNGAFWHLQQVYPALYVPGGSATAPMVFIEDQPSPYNEPGIHIYAGFGVTVPGDITAVSSGSQVIVDSSPLVDAKGNTIAGSHLKVSFRCP
jgi:hypothetical protein